MKGDLLAQCELVHISGHATINQLEQAIQLVGAGLQHLKRFVCLDRIGHHAAIAANQAGQEAFADTRLSSLGLDLIKGHRLGLDAKCISHATHNSCSIFGLVARQVKRLIRLAAGLALGDAKGLAATDRTAHFLGQGLISFWNELKAASFGCVRQLAFWQACRLWHQIALSLGGLSGDQFANGCIDGASDLDTLFHGGRAGFGNQRHLSVTSLFSAGHGLQRNFFSWCAGYSARQDLAKSLF